MKKRNKISGVENTQFTNFLPLYTNIKKEKKEEEKEKEVEFSDLFHRELEKLGVKLKK